MSGANVIAHVEMDNIQGHEHAMILLLGAMELAVVAITLKPDPAIQDDVI